MKKIYCKQCGKLLGKTYKTKLLSYDGAPWKFGTKPTCKEYPNCMDIKKNTVNFREINWNSKTKQVDSYLSIQTK